MNVWVLVIWLNFNGVSFPADAYTSEAACTAAGQRAVGTQRIGTDEAFICQPVQVHAAVAHLLGNGAGGTTAGASVPQCTRPRGMIAPRECSREGSTTQPPRRKS